MGKDQPEVATDDLDGDGCRCVRVSRGQPQMISTEKGEDGSGQPGDRRELWVDSGHFLTEHFIRGRIIVESCGLILGTS